MWTFAEHINVCSIYIYIILSLHKSARIHINDYV
jgi:hypothetical protein